MSLAISKEILALKQAVEAFAEEFKEVLVVYLHGSVVEGFAREDSDLDLAVVIRDDPIKLRGVKLSANLNRVLFGHWCSFHLQVAIKKI